MKIKLDETGKVISILNAGIDNSYIDAPDLPSDHEFGVIDYAYINGSYDKVPSEINEYNPTNDEIRAMRQQAYKDRSDSLYLAWQKYLVMEDERAEQAKQMWLEEVAKIDKEFPYNE